MSLASDDKQNWREKYLDTLDAQEQQERIHQTQLELLRRLLVRVSVAAEGQGETLDTHLGQLRDQLRHPNGHGLEALTARIEQATLNLDQRRADDVQEVRASLGSCVRHLESFELSPPLKKSLQDYLAQLPARAQKIHLYPALLQQLAELQQQALAEVSQPSVPKSGLLTRLRKKAPVDTGVAAVEAAKNPSALSSESEPVTTADGWVNALARALDEFLAQLQTEERLAQEVTRLRDQLAEYRANLTAPDKLQQQLLDTLARLRPLVIDAYLAASRAFAEYLDLINRELADIYLLLGGAVKSESERQEASRQLQHQMLREMSDLEAQAHNASDLKELKSQVQSQLGNIRQALDKYQQSEQAQQQLAQQLNSLGEKLKSMEQEAEKNRANLEQQRHRALHDPLTDLPNREAYKERSQVEMQRWLRYGRPLSIAVVDIDRFKAINDNYGHQTGDKVIKVIGRALAKRLREVDFFCRYGGEEFVALLPETAGEKALALMDSIREAIAKASFNYKDKPLPISVSVGLTQLHQGDTLEQAFERADQALYAAKAAGRNCCHLN